jgi:DNA polymerase I
VQVVDFETVGIEGNPTVRPPRPVGCAFKRPGYKSAYVTDMARVRERLGIAIDNKEPLLFHNAKFDLSVMRTHLSLEVKDPLLIHDTLFQIFLHDPYAETFSLKPSATRILGIPPEEQDAVKNWVLSNIRCKLSEWGAHIASAPVDLVAPYAKGDVDRTYALYEHLKEKIPLAPYQREQRLLPIIMASERSGVKCDVEHLGRDLALYEKALSRCDDNIRSILGSPSCNLDSGEELADALDALGCIKEWPRTPTGKRSTSRNALEAAVTHPELLMLLRYRGALEHCLGSFMRPWLELAQDYNGRLHPEWNQVRQYSTDRKSKGTRTGRLSCSKPNFQNPPNEYEIEIPEGYPVLPLMRRYLIPDMGYVWCKRDYSQQELRILAHYSEGRLYARYQENPRIDAHEETGNLITEFTGLELPRKFVKIIGFSMIYGSGIPALAGQLKSPMDEAAHMKSAYLYALPEVHELMEDCKRRGRHNEPVVTWGGREYYVEPPENGRSFEYKLLNYLIQGSAADCTKEAIIRWHQDPGQGLFLCTVHDEVNIQVPLDRKNRDTAKLREAMESVEFDVKMLSDGYRGQSWAQLEKCK